MPKAFSSDIHWRVVWLHVFLKLSSAEVPDFLFISKKSVERYSNKFITTGDVEPKTHKCGPYKKLSEEVILIDLVLNNPGIFLHELQYDLTLLTGTSVHSSTIFCTLKRLGFSCHKIKHIALQRSEEKRGEFAAEMVTYAPSMFLRVDETGCDRIRRRLMRNYGYVIRGIPPRNYSGRSIFT